MKPIFITGTDTGAGKTLVTGLLAKYLFEAGKSVITQKWVQTGSRKPDDVLQHTRISGMKYDSLNEKYISSYIFKLPSSPHLAAKNERRIIDTKNLLLSTVQLSKKYEYIIIEGSGGILVPLTEKVLTVDLIKKSKASVILVVLNRLGAINHALLTLEALKKRRIEISGIVFNNISEASEKILEDNASIVRKITGIKNCFMLRNMKEPYVLDAGINSFFKETLKKRI
ncbi:MAG: dethiobiotin synthase [Candidatus Firestonebacteria bacterium RIFOXYC2_FULL_39_67]|nr:MAG: dethiobiotin synthase [Candidatus Firestonebacteria bacterium RIFOXYC2_FULL_39_67]